MRTGQGAARQDRPVEHRERFFWRAPSVVEPRPKTSDDRSGSTRLPIVRQCTLVPLSRSTDLLDGPRVKFLQRAVDALPRQKQYLASHGMGPGRWFSIGSTRTVRRSDDGAANQVWWTWPVSMQRCSTIWWRSWIGGRSTVLWWRLSNTLEKAFCPGDPEGGAAPYGRPEFFNTDQAVRSGAGSPPRSSSRPG